MSGTQQALLMIGSAIVSPLTWNSADKSAEIDLSSSDTVATRHTGGGTFRGVRAVQSRNTGKYLFELEVLANPATSGGIVMGVALSTAPLTVYVGSDVNGWGLSVDIGSGTSNTTHSGFGPSFGVVVAPTHRLGVAVDNPNGKMWFLIDGVSIQGDPVAGTAEILAPTPGSILFPMFSGFDNPAAVHIYGLASDIAFPVTGYTPWGTP